MNDKNNDKNNDKIKDQKDCKHEQYDGKQIMDFAFNVCRDCGYQWPA